MRRVKLFDNHLCSHVAGDDMCVHIYRRDYRLMLAVVRAADQFSYGNHKDSDWIALDKALDAFNAKPRGKR